MKILDGRKLCGSFAENIWREEGMAPRLTLIPASAAEFPGHGEYLVMAAAGQAVWY